MHLSKKHHLKVVPDHSKKPKTSTRCKNIYPALPSEHLRHPIWAPIQQDLESHNRWVDRVEISTTSMCNYDQETSVVHNNYSLCIRHLKRESSRSLLTTLLYPRRHKATTWSTLCGSFNIHFWTVDTNLFLPRSISGFIAFRTYSRTLVQPASWATEILWPCYPYPQTQIRIYRKIKPLQ